MAFRTGRNAALPIRAAPDWAMSVGSAVDATDPVSQPATEKEKRTMTKQPKPTTGNRQPAHLLGGRSMTEKTYIRLLAKLGISPYGAGSALGISPRMSMRYAAGTHPIPDTVAKLLMCYVERGYV